jgi:lipid-A-disaccharide synthase
LFFVHLLVVLSTYQIVSKPPEPRIHAPSNHKEQSTKHKAQSPKSKSPKHKEQSPAYLLSFAFMPKRLRLMIVAGEPSGDAHSAALVKALRDVAPEIEFELFGATGPMMRAAGVETIVNSDSLAIMGIVEVGRVLPRFIRAFRSLKAAANQKQPDAVILVDWPEFNLRLATSLRRQGRKIIYYISPQLWAWRPGRVNNVRRDVDLLLSILPFETEWYKERGVDHVEYVGHPLSGEVKANVSREEFCEQHNLDLNRPIISFLPGSRHKELVRILPPMLDAIEVLSKRRADLQFVLVIAPSRNINEAQEIMSGRGDDSLSSKVVVVQHQTRDAIAAADVAAVASGTATLEAALLGTPLVIVYKESPVNWHTLGRLINVPHFGLVNLVAGREIAKELIQNDLIGDNLAGELLRLLEEETNARAREGLHSVAHRLGEGGASQRAARVIMESL